MESMSIQDTNFIIIGKSRFKILSYKITEEALKIEEYVDPMDFNELLESVQTENSKSEDVRKRFPSFNIAKMKCTITDVTGDLQEADIIIDTLRNRKPKETDTFGVFGRLWKIINKEESEGNYFISASEILTPSSLRKKGMDEKWIRIMINSARGM